ncbi:hypothetical protein Tco_1431162 [Tanacetum coccineum]
MIVIHFFQPMFDEYFKPPPNVDHPVPEFPTSVLAASTSLPSSTTVDQDAPSTSTSQTTLEQQSSKVKATLKSAWTEKDQIDNLLKERRLMRSLEKFVGGKLYEGDLWLRQKNHMILSYDVLINQIFTMKMEILLELTSNKLMVEHAEYDESNTYVLERFNTTAGNPVKKILLKLNLSDHKPIKDGGGVNESQERRSIESFSRQPFKKGMSMTVQKSQVHKMAKFQDGKEIVLG